MKPKGCCHAFEPTPTSLFTQIRLMCSSTHPPQRQPRSPQAPAAAFMAAGEFTTFEVAFYRSAVNYTVRGYDDFVMSPHWYLLGPQEAASGPAFFATPR